MAYMQIEMAMAAGPIPLASPASPAGGAASAVGGAPLSVQAAPLQLAGGLTFHARPGDVLQGNLALHTAADKDLKLGKDGLALYFRGLDETTITTYHKNKHGTSRHVATGGAELFRIIAPTVQEGQNSFARGGVYRFPFTFHLPPSPQQAPHTLVVAMQQEGLATDEDNYSCQVRNQRRHQATAKIAYEIKAKCHVSGILNSNLHAQVDIIVDPVYPIAPAPHALTGATASNRITIPDHCCCDWFGSKPVSASASIAKTALTNGETLPVDLTVQNDSDERVASVSVSLQNAVIVRTNGGALPEVRRFLTVQRNEIAAHIAAHSKQTLRVPILVANLTPDVVSPYFSSSSCLLVKVKMEEFGKPIDLRIPLACPYYAPLALAPQQQQQLYSQQQPPQAYQQQSYQHAAAYDQPPPGYPSAPSAPLQSQLHAAPPSDSTQPLLAGATTAQGEPGSAYGGTA